MTAPRSFTKFPTACLCSTLCLVTWSAHADTDALQRLADLSIEQLMDETVTSVSKHDERLGDAASAITVLTREDLLRSGSTTVIDALRIVPGMNVAALNSGQWAASARGFNGVYANKLLVLVDGRAVYLPQVAGVQWELQQLLLEDIDRIEVIRGPGATLWGANAVNGVINIVTRSADRTPGGFAYGGAGTALDSMGGARYGGALNERTYLRVSGTFQNWDDASLDRPQPDAWHGRAGDVRLDRDVGGGRLTWLAGAASFKLDSGATEESNYNSLVRWQQRLSGDDNFEAQLYFDRTKVQFTPVQTANDTYDAAFHHTFAAGDDHVVVWGAGYRHFENTWQPSDVVAVFDPRIIGELLSAFVQDEYKIIPERLSVTAGVKWEHNSFTGSEWQPSLRAALKLTPSSTWWAAISRAVRTPAVIEASDTLAFAYAAPFQAPDGNAYVPVLWGNHALRSEVLHAYETGFRTQVTPHASIDVAAFYNRYRDLIDIGAIQALLPGMPYGIALQRWNNEFTATTTGVEFGASLFPRDDWRLSLSYSLLSARAHGGPADVRATVEHGSPRHQAMMRSSHDIGARLSIDLQARYIDAVLGAPAYTTADVHTVYHATSTLDVTLVGQNLLQPRHTEQPGIFVNRAAPLQRNAYLKLGWRF